MSDPITLKEYLRLVLVIPIAMIVVERIRFLAKEAEGQRSQDTIRDWLDLADMLEHEIKDENSQNSHPKKA